MNPSYWELNADNWPTVTDMSTYGDCFALGYCPQPPTERKLRLLVIACYRLIWDQIPDTAYHAAIEAGEEFADGGSLEAAAIATDAATDAASNDLSWWGYHLSWNFAAIPADGMQEGGRFPCWRQLIEDLERDRNHFPSFGHTRDKARTIHLALFQDIFGNPFRPVAFDPKWRTSTVLALARQMYESRDFSPMPILADTLDDAGCEHPDIIAHCRSDGSHARGCWAVDLALGKE